MCVNKSWIKSFQGDYYLNKRIFVFDCGVRRKYVMGIMKERYLFVY